MENNSLRIDIFKAYYEARKSKHQSAGVMSFEMKYESNLLELYDEIKSGQYKIRPSTCFIVFKPHKREIFAADFRDRIVHHLVHAYLSPIFESIFINDNYGCRIGRGTSMGIKRLNHFIRSCSKNYKEDCYVLKLDILGYFMAIDKNILFEKVSNGINNHKKNLLFDKTFLLSIIHKIIFYDPTKNCKINGRKEDWSGLPKSKSLFYASKSKGLPIGNLTSQLFGNIYLNDFDHFIKYKLGCKYYGRYVDDMVIVHSDKEYLKSIIPDIRTYLKEELFLEIHPRKIYLQSHKKGVNFLGAIVKPYRVYIRNSTKGNFLEEIQKWNIKFKNNGKIFSKGEQTSFLSSVNSYLGIMDRFNTYKLRKKILETHLQPTFSKSIYISDNYGKINWSKDKVVKL